MSYRLTKFAAADVDLIAEFYGRNNRIAAVRFVDAVFSAIKLLEANPRMGASLTNGDRRLVL